MSFDYRPFLPEPPEGCLDPDFYRTMREFEFVRWHPDFEDRKEAMKPQLRSEEFAARAIAALDDPTPDLRYEAGRLLIWTRKRGAVDFVLRLFDDPSEEVRGGIAEAVAGVAEPRLEQPLAHLALTDPSPFVRCGAVTGLSGQNPTFAIPILLSILGQDRSTTELGHSPSDRAATALDEIMQTEWTQTRHPDGLRSLPAGPRDLSALREQAIEYLRLYRERSEQD